MKKFLTFIFILLIVISVGNLYSILHNLVTYKISPEYYNKYLFYRFGILDIDLSPKQYIEKAPFENPLFVVSKIGIINTSIFSFIYGLIIALVGLVHSKNNHYLKVSIKSFLLTILVSFIAGIIGYVFGNYFYTPTINAVEFNKDNLIKIINYKSFLTVSIMRTYSLIGSFLGLVIAIIYSIRQKMNKNLY